MIKNRSTGFTLIELLVVIAIIGILSAVVLASLNTARSRGNDAAVQSNLSTIQTQAEIVYPTLNNSYNSGAAISAPADCTVTPQTASSTIFGDTTIKNAVLGAKNAIGVAPKCAVSGTAYAIQASLTGTNNYWCVDSAGFAGKMTTAITGTACQ